MNRKRNTTMVSCLNAPIPCRIDATWLHMGELMISSDERPWGRWEEYLNEPGYRVKRIIVNPGRRLSLQRHEERSEYWVVVSGTGLATVDGEELHVGPGDAVHVARRAVHRLSNVGPTALVIMETQLGNCLESDIVRLDDDFGRAKSTGS